MQFRSQNSLYIYKYNTSVVCYSLRLDPTLCSVLLKLQSTVRIPRQRHATPRHSKFFENRTDLSRRFHWRINLEMTASTRYFIIKDDDDDARGSVQWVRKRFGLQLWIVLSACPATTSAERKIILDSRERDTILSSSKSNFVRKYRTRGVFIRFVRDKNI